MSLSVIWITLVSTFALFFPDEKLDTVFMILLLVGWGILGGFGIAIQRRYSKKFPAQLLFPKSEKIEELIILQFSRNEVTSIMATMLIKRKNTN
jgi:hypothetical protein